MHFLSYSVYYFGQPGILDRNRVLVDGRTSKGRYVQDCPRYKQDTEVGTALATDMLKSSAIHMNGHPFYFRKHGGCVSFNYVFVSLELSVVERF